MTTTTVLKATAPKFPPLGPTDRAIMNALLGAIDAIREQTTRIEVVRMLEANDVQGAIDVIRWDVGEDFLRRNIPATLRDAFELAGESAEQKLSRAGLKLSFDLLNPRAVDWVRRRSGDLIRDFGDSSKLGIRALIQEAFENGVAPRRLASQIIDAGIGLTERYSLAVERYRSRLEDDENVDLTQAQVDARTERYADKLLRNRAETIARTEVLTAENEGQRELWRQAVDEGLIRANAEREWIATEEERTCEECMDLDGERVPLFGTYPGGLVGPPAHPMCRCAEKLIT